MKLRFNNQKFIEQAKAIYGSDVIDECQKLSSKELLHKFIRYADCAYPVVAYKCPEIGRALNDICENEIGNITLNLLYKCISSDFRQLKIWNNENTFENRDLAIFVTRIEEKEDKLKKDNNFDPQNFIIYLAPSHVPDIRLSRYDGKNVSYDCPETLDTALFHELLHVFHKLVGRNQSGGTSALDYFYGDSEIKQIWGKFGRTLTDKELSDITGWYYDKEQQKVRFDPINCNMYEICKWSKTLTSRKDFRQRIAHKDQDDLQRFCQEKNIGLNDVLYKINEIILNLDEWLLDVPENGYTERVR